MGLAEKSFSETPFLHVKARIKERPGSGMLKIEGGHGFGLGFFFFFFFLNQLAPPHPLPKSFESSVLGPGYVLLMPITPQGKFKHSSMF